MAAPYSLLCLRLRTDIKWLRRTSGEIRLRMMVFNLVHGRNADESKGLIWGIPFVACLVAFSTPVQFSLRYLHRIRWQTYEKDWQLQKLKPVVYVLRVTNGFEEVNVPSSKKRSSSGLFHIFFEMIGLRRHSDSQPFRQRWPSSPQTWLHKLPFQELKLGGGEGHLLETGRLKFDVYYF